MALTGLDIYKLLPASSKDPAEKAHANCKECGFPTCLAFAMKLAAKQAELSACPYVSEDAKAKLSAAAAPPIRLITLSADGRQVKAGNETVLFRHEKTFYNPAGLFVRVADTLSADQIATLAKAVDGYKVDYVGMALRLDGLAVDAVSGDAGKFAAAVAAVRGMQPAVDPGDRGPGDHGSGSGQSRRRDSPALRRDRRQLGGDGEAGQER